MIDVDFKLSVNDGKRHFDLSVKFATNAPFAALYGASGAGKTLTLQAIAGLLQPSEGHIKLNGHTLFDSRLGINLKPADRQVGYLFQNYALFPHLSIRENIAFGLTSWSNPCPTPEAQARVQMLLDRFGLDALAESRPDTLSGGQQQRAALARALARNAKILLLDEPFASLHPSLRKNLRHELAQMRREWNIPALMITHDIEDAEALADVVFVYEEGQVIHEIAPQELSLWETTIGSKMSHLRNIGTL
jgi:molybdate transport system ATP-binding protein